MVILIYTFVTEAATAKETQTCNHEILNLYYYLTKHVKTSTRNCGVGVLQSRLGSRGLCDWPTSEQYCNIQQCVAERVEKDFEAKRESDLLNVALQLSSSLLQIWCQVRIR